MYVCMYVCIIYIGCAPLRIQASYGPVLLSWYTFHFHGMHLVCFFILIFRYCLFCPGIILNKVYMLYLLYHSFSWHKLCGIFLHGMDLMVYFYIFVISFLFYMLK